MMLLSSLTGLECPYETIFPAFKTLGYFQGKKTLNMWELGGLDSPFALHSHHELP